MLRYLLAALFVSCLNINACLAADNAPVQDQGISYSQVLNLITGLFIVLFLFFCIAWFLKRVTGAGGVGRGYLKIIDALHLGTRERIVLVKVADSYLLLGISAGNINPLHVLTGELPQQPEPTQPRSGSRFRGLLQRAGLKNR